jgi:hypothetical protein
MLLGETGMLDGNRYYAAFPDENPEIRLRMRTLFDLLKKLEKEFRQHIEHFPIEPTSADGDNEPGFQEPYVEFQSSPATEGDPTEPCQ